MRAKTTTFSLLLLMLVAIAILSLWVDSSVPGAREILVEIRIPRLLAAIAVGAGLSVAGAVLQVIFSNPLCEPYTLGISSGASLGAVLGSVLGGQWAWGGLAGSALIGAAVFAAALSFLANRFEDESSGLLLSGVMLGLLGSSLVAVVMALADSAGVQSALYWLLGDLSRVQLQGAIFLSFGVTLLVFIVWMLRDQLDAFLLGEEGAASAGVEVSRVRRIHLVLSSALVALCVSGSGIIGFIGLMMPHFARRLGGPLHRSVIPFSALSGAVALATADWLARNVRPSFEMPVGVVTALVGAPFFIWMVGRSRSGGRT